MRLINQIRLFFEPLKDEIKHKVDPLHLQILGYATTFVGYMFLLYLRWVRGMDFAEIVSTPWLGEIIMIVLAIFAGIPEILLIWVFETTITKFGRGLFKKRLDNAFMVGCIPLTWASFGAVAAVIHFTGAILFHYGEKQPK